ncbi:outer envelope protein [Rhodoferax lacus]|uniref:Outer envelope protein n=1 Tax=Rhodoferax lacus TaxID=2184758 RepID=A0A3E1RF60_9BURK|nr:outer envelope protein [Rhodoferax lacus]RFO97672.1 outer envelope protein [Rhodoferax lacus]
MSFVSWKHASVLLAIAGCSATAQAADWSDTSIGYRYGTDFAEPRNANKISKDILNLTHASGYKYGSNFFNVDMLLSDDKDPAGDGSGNGAQEIYVVYRHTLDLGKVTGSPIKFGPVKGVGVVAGFDFNTKTDAGYNSKKRMLVAGPSLMLDVPGFLNVALLALWESNAPYNTATKVSTPRYAYEAHPMLSVTWGIPVMSGAVPLSFEGYANFIASKGKSEFNGDTAGETNIDMMAMFDVSGLMGAKPKTFRAGLEYQYWENKFGNNNANPFYKGGATANTTMARVEYHF